MILIVEDEKALYVKGLICFSSIKTRIVIVYLLVFSLLLASLSIFLYVALNKIVYVSADQETLISGKSSGYSY